MEPGRGQKFTLYAVPGVLRKAASLFESQYPAGLALTAAICVVLPVLRGGGALFCSAVPLAALLIVWCLIPTRDALLRFALPGLIAMISVLHYGQTAHNVIGETAGRTTFAAEAILRVSDASSSSRPESVFRQNTLNCRVEAMRYGPEGAWIAFGGDLPRVMLDLRRWEGDGGPAAGYGDILRVDGAFQSVPRPLFDGSFDYAAYLETERIYEVFYPESIEITAHGRGFLRGLYDLRDAAMARLCSGFRSEEAARIAMSMLTGRQISMSRETREGFLSSGTVHILTVSGTHVMIFAVLMMTLLAWVPYRIRCSVVLIPVFFYTLATGMREPAMRAYVMLAVFFLLKALLLRQNPLNVLMLAALIIVCVEPGSLFKPGVYYSFLTVGALVCLPISRGSLICKSLIRRESEDIPFKYMPRGRLNRRKIMFRVFSILSASAAACVVTGALSLLYQGLFPVSAIPANLVVIPMTGAAFWISGGILFLSWWPSAAAMMSRLLEYVFLGIMWNGRFFGNLMPNYVPKPPVWTVVLFLCACFFVLLGKKFRPVMAAVCVMAALMLYWFLRPTFFRPEVLIVTGGGMETDPMTAVSDPVMSRASVINVPNYECGRALVDWLRSRGIEVCREAAVSSGRKSSFDGLEFAASNLPVLDIVCPSNAVRKMPPGAVVHAMPVNGAFHQYYVRDGRFFFSVGTIDGSLLSNVKGRGRLELRQNDRDLYNDDLPLCSGLTMQIQPIESHP